MGIRTDNWRDYLIWKESADYLNECGKIAERENIFFFLLAGRMEIERIQESVT